MTATVLNSFCWGKGRVGIWRWENFPGYKVKQTNQTKPKENNVSSLLPFVSKYRNEQWVCTKGNKVTAMALPVTPGEREPGKNDVYFTVLFNCLFCLNQLTLQDLL